MIIPVIAIITFIIIFSILQISTDPERPFFQAAFKNDVPGLIELSYNINSQLYLEVYHSSSQKETSIPTSITPEIQQVPKTQDIIISFFTIHPDLIPTPSKTKFCSLVDKSGNNLFHWAAKSLSIDSATFLYKIGCDFTRGNNQGSTPFMWAATDQSLRPEEYLEYLQQNEEELREKMFQYEMDKEKKQQEKEKDEQTEVENDQNDQKRNQKPHEIDNEKEQLQEKRRTKVDDLDENMIVEKDSNETPDQANRVTTDTTTKKTQIPAEQQYTNIKFNPMMQLLASFARQRDLNQYKTQLFNNNTSKFATSQTNALLSSYKPETIPGSWYYRLIHHSNKNGQTALHFASEFLSVHSIKTIILLLSPPSLPNEYAPLISSITTEGNNAMHMLPKDCLDINHCKKILTFFILLGFNPTTPNKYKRTLEHHISYQSITPLLEIQDEWLIARYRGKKLEGPQLIQYTLKYGGTAPISSSGHWIPHGEEEIDGLDQQLLNRQSNEEQQSDPSTAQNEQDGNNHREVLQQQTQQQNSTQPVRMKRRVPPPQRQQEPSDRSTTIQSISSSIGETGKDSDKQIPIDPPHHHQFIGEDRDSLLSKLQAKSDQIKKNQVVRDEL